MVYRPTVYRLKIYWLVIYRPSLLVTGWGFTDLESTSQEYTVLRSTGW
jgi:hypothetical protein